MLKIEKIKSVLKIEICSILRACIWEAILNDVQGAPKHLTQKSAVINSELEATVWSGKFPKLRLVLKFSFKPPDSMPFVQSYEVTSSLNRTVVVCMGRGGTIVWPPRSPDLTPLDFSVWGYVKDREFYFFLQV